ncbi:MAG: beta-galactosidase [Rikenellaceae bacterium]|nr:beta-galactosidase [Rikenellaceae bacterium]
MKRFFIYIALLICGFSTISAREVYVLNDNWKFFFTEENSSDNAREITLPHTWNAEAATNASLYCQTTANYQHSLQIPAEWRGKRLFLRFGGVQSVADIFVNGHHAGNHHGGYTAFAVEITDLVSYGYNNSLLVVVSNAMRNDVLPTSTEDNAYGGIYRDVELIVTEQTTISPLYYGTEGVMIHQTEVAKERVAGYVDIALAGRKESTCLVNIDFVAPDGYVSLSKSVKTKLDGKLFSLPFTIENPELWSPAQPRLYKVRVTVGNDMVEVTTGFRKIEVDAETKLTINGRRIRIHGVTLHHDQASVGNALTKREYNSDIALVRELGANAIHSATAPHAQYLYDECDRLGILAWVDVPFTRSPFFSDIAYYATERFEENGIEQLHEIVLQNINHPSVAMWGIFSMLRGNAKPQLNYIRMLNNTAKQLDASRPTVALSNQDGDINFITDLIVWHQATGWSKGAISDLDLWQGALRNNWGHLRQGVCYGDDFSGQAETPNRALEQKQLLFHEGYTRLIDEGLFWGVWVNSMFDFGSLRHACGQRTTGLVDVTHRERKDIFHLYKSLWNRRTPTLHIVSKDRGVRTCDKHSITVFSSVGRPTMTINGDTVACENVARTVYRTDTLTLKGINDIKVSVGDKSDEMTLTIGSYPKR